MAARKKTGRRPGRPRKQPEPIQTVPAEPQIVTTESVTAEHVEAARDRVAEIVGGAIPPTESESTDPTDQPERKRRGWPKGKPRPPRKPKTADADVVLAPLLKTAFLVTGRWATERYELSPAFTEDQAQALGDAWAPVIALYLPTDSPWTGAIITSAIVLAPYGFQIGARVRGKHTALERYASAQDENERA
jgi:hypothetical protein